MNLVNDLENDLAFAFLVDKKHSEKINSKEVVELMDRVREVLQQVSSEEEHLDERVLITAQVETFTVH